MTHDDDAPQSDFDALATTSMHVEATVPWEQTGGVRVEVLLDCDDVDQAAYFEPGLEVMARVRLGAPAGVATHRKA